jgi:ribonuclease HII
VAGFEIEASFTARGYRCIAGVDEVGRGALCGPVVAAAVILPFSWIAAFSPAAGALGFARGFTSTAKARPLIRIPSPPCPDWLGRVEDSKRLAPRERRALAREILAAAEAVGLGLCSNQEIDRRNIHRASLEAMRRAVDHLGRRPDVVLVDGFALRDYPGEQQAVPHGDAKSLTIAAASIVAKVLRDQMLTRCDRIFPGYSLDRNKGYATPDHIRALEALGPTSFHRKSFRLQFDPKLFP